MDFGEPGNLKVDVIGKAKRSPFSSRHNVDLLERFKRNPAETTYAMRVKLGWRDELAADSP